jgi:hypothetical protein
MLPRTRRSWYIFTGGSHYQFLYVLGTFPLGISPSHVVTVREGSEPI